MGKRISQLELAGPLTASDVLAVVQDGRTKKATIEQVGALTDDSCQCTLVSRYTTVGTGGAAQKYFLQTWTVPADLITVDGSWLECHAAGYFAANGNNKNVGLTLKQNSTGLNQANLIPTFAYNNKYWQIEAKIQRMGKSEAMLTVYLSAVDNNGAALQTPGVIHYVGNVTGVEWEAGDLQIVIEATNGTANANDTNCSSFIIEGHLLDPNS